jgi:uncharacterized protein
MSKSTLVIGASTNATRYSFLAINRLREHGHPVYALGLRAGRVGDVDIFTEHKFFSDIHTVTLYVGPNHQDNIRDYVIGLNPSRVIFNPGTEDDFFQSLLRKANIPFEEACTLVMLGTDQY